MVRRWTRSVWAASVLALAAAGSCAAAHAQDAGSDADALQHLTVWIVRPVTAGDRALLRAQADLRDISVYRESTAGDFGRPASEAGQTAGSYGRPASEVGKNASDTGVNASDYGQTASSLPSGVPPSQTAGSYGTTAGSFGTAASDYHGPSKAPTVGAGTFSRDSKGTAWGEFLRALHEALPVLEVRFVEVYGATLRDLLAAPQSVGGAPDILLSDRMPDWWAGTTRGSLLLALGREHRVPAFPGDAHKLHPQRVYTSAYGLARAPHPAAAREFLEWWNGRDFLPEARPARESERRSPAAQVALSAVGTVLAGGSLEGSLADRDMAPFSSVLTREEVLGGVPGPETPQGTEQPLPSDLGFRSEVLREAGNDRFAVVLLHTQCTSRTAYCDLYPLVMLRSDDGKRWKVLQVSLGMGGSDAARSYDLAAPDAWPGTAPAEVSLPRLAAPIDGDHRAMRSGLSLWWDNGGGGSLLLVEWQAGGGSGAPASHLYLVNDTEPKLRTEVSAPFIGVGGAVRWRVWALGAGGVLRLTGWRTVTMVQ